MNYIGFGLDLGTVILAIAFVAFVIDIFLVVAGKYIEKWEIYSEISLSTGFATLIISFLYFVYSILSTDYNFFYVSEYVSNNMDIFLRLSTVWSSQPGSYFFWAFLIAISYFTFRMLFREYAHEKIIWRIFVLAASQVAVLIFLALISDPFKINSTIPSDGLGLNPLLMTIWNVIHPSIIFISYALCMLPMVIAIARISVLEDGKVPDFEGKKKLDSLFDFLVSLAWFALSAGIIIGAYWAYITLGWGGFWAWDPVETGSLIPWLFLTLYFHGKPFFKREYLSNYLISMGFISTLFITYLTRSGVVSSVHAFVPTGTLEQLLSIFIPEDSFLMSLILRIIPEEKIFFLFLAIVVMFLIPLILGIKNREILKINITLKKNDFQESRHRTTALKVSFISGLVGTYVLITGLIFPVVYDALGLFLTAPIVFEVYSFIHSLFLLITDVILDGRIFTYIIYIAILLSLFYHIGFKKGQIKRIYNFLNSSGMTVLKNRRTDAIFTGIYIIIFSLLFPLIYDSFGYILTDPIVSLFQNAIDRFLFMTEVQRPDGFLDNFIIDQGFYNTILTIFGGLMLLAQFFCTFYPRIQIRRKFQLLIGGVVAGVLFSITGFFYRTGDLVSFLGPGNPIISFFGNFWTTSEKANLVLPLMLLGIVGLVAEFVNIAMKEEKNLLRKSSRVMLHLSFLLILLGALISSNTSTTATVTVDPSTNNMEIPGTTLRISIIGLEKPTVSETSLHSIDYDTQFMITSGSQIVGIGISRLYVDHQGRVGHEVTIIGNFLSDVYIVTMNVAENPLTGTFDFASLQIKIIPYINILWFGCILLLLAIAPLTISRAILVREVFTVKKITSEEEQDKTDKLEDTINNGGQVID